jgi:hypothetical protein
MAHSHGVNHDLYGCDQFGKLKDATPLWLAYKAKYFPHRPVTLSFDTPHDSYWLPFWT